jgi:hypothetical protein
VIRAELFDQNIKQTSLSGKTIIEMAGLIQIGISNLRIINGFYELLKIVGWMSVTILRHFWRTGTDVIIFEIFSPKNWRRY